MSIVKRLQVHHRNQGIDMLPFRKIFRRPAVRRILFPFTVVLVAIGITAFYALSA